MTVAQWSVLVRSRKTEDFKKDLKKLPGFLRNIAAVLMFLMGIGLVIESIIAAIAGVFVWSAIYLVAGVILTIVGYKIKPKQTGGNAEEDKIDEI